MLDLVVSDWLSAFNPLQYLCNYENSGKGSYHQEAKNNHIESGDNRKKSAKGERSGG